MNHRSSFTAHRRRSAQLSAAACLAIGALAASCSGPGSGPCQPPISSSFLFDKLTYSQIDKVDVLLAVDNSRSMSDKQQILSFAVADLVKGLVNPPCINVATGEVETAPAGPLDACPAGTERQIDPIIDMHIGVISSSLGGHGSDACSASGAGKQSNNDKGHLLARLDPTQFNEAETYQNLKFLAWDPSQRLAPPGEADIDADSAADPNTTALVPTIRDMVLGVGEIGCGYESQLESWYRFLIDPTPYESISLDASGKVIVEGIDKTLLEQRKAFLRPDSLLAIVMLTDENDCSIRETGQYYYAAQQKSAGGSPFHLPKARAICETNPDDECCFSCGQPVPKNDDGSPKCPDDPICKAADGKVAYLTEDEDSINLRCFDQKRRFGIDFLYPIDRYVQALKSTSITDRTGNVVPNPIFSDLDPSDNNNNTRTSGLVFLTGIVGVPWQDIARTDANGVPNLKAGLDPEKRPRGGFKSADEMSAPLPGKDYNTWDLILGDPTKYPDPAALPRDPLMLESIDPRSGSNPITGDLQVTSAQPLANKINGHEWTIPSRDDLQYACIFPLLKLDAGGNLVPDKKDCSTEDCDCSDPGNDNPLCEVNPATGKPTDQVRAKAYPGVRELQLLKDLGSQGLVGSVCPAQITNPGDVDFGYRPAILGVLDRLVPVVSVQCLQPVLSADDQGRVSCLIIEAQAANDASQCNKCGEAGRIPVPDEHKGAVDAIEQDNPGASYNCYCEIPQVQNASSDLTKTNCKKNFDQNGYDLCACQYTPRKSPVTAGGEPVDGWCYVDQSQGVGNPEIVEACPDTEKRLIRFVGAGEATPGATLYIMCSIEKEGASTCAE